MQQGSPCSASSGPPGVRGPGLTVGGEGGAALCWNPSCFPRELSAPRTGPERKLLRLSEHWRDGKHMVCRTNIPRPDSPRSIFMSGKAGERSSSLRGLEVGWPGTGGQGRRAGRWGRALVGEGTSVPTLGRLRARSCQSLFIIQGILYSPTKFRRVWASLANWPRDPARNSGASKKNP